MSWPHWLPQGTPHVPLSKAAWAYLLPAQGSKLYTRTDASGQAFHWWIGCKGELSNLLRYLDEESGVAA